MIPGNGIGFPFPEQHKVRSHFKFSFTTSKCILLSIIFLSNLPTQAQTDLNASSLREMSFLVIITDALKTA